jgi:hypothetical protein
MINNNLVLIFKKIKDNKKQTIKDNKKQTRNNFVCKYMVKNKK